jgi:thiazole/oxazole-forming peptide maturase SagD family component
MTRYLKPDCFVGRDAGALWFVPAASGSDLKLEADESTLDQAISEIRASNVFPGHVFGRSRVDLLDRLDEIGALTRQPGNRMPIPTARGKLVVVPLLEELLSPASPPHGVGRLLVTASEALWLPPTVRPHRRIRHLVRVFVSGLDPEARQRCYTFAATRGVQSVARDWPTDDSLVQCIASIRKIQNPCTYDFGSHRLSFEGEKVGRLSIVQRMSSRQTTIGAAGGSVIQAAAEYINPNLKFNAPQSERLGWGTSGSQKQALRSAFSEAVERFVSGNVRSRDLVFETAERLPHSWLDPRSVLALSREQQARHAELAPFSPSQSRLWVEGRRVNGEHVFVLADLVYYPFAEPNLHTHATSSGVAAHANAAKARCHAYLELEERHAFMSVWLGKSQRERVKKRSLPPRALELVNALEQNSWRVTVVDISQSNIPVAMAIAENDDEIVLGSAAGPRSFAVTKALTELAPCISGLPERQDIAPEAVASPSDHQMLYRQRHFSEHARFLTSSGNEIDFLDMPDLEIDSLEIPDQAVFVKFRAPQPLRLCVVRCLCPGLIPIAFGWDQEPLGLSAAAALVHSANPDYDGDPLIPHPFA